ncbi:MAG: antibiotic biosynthesis monooxygenase [Rhizobiales bacterium]|nr:antibiotic biosynthesis monooxygenase [Hyphomicrobiales bacterium]
MSKAALFVRHKTKPGKRDEVRKVWERHMRPAIAGNPGHEAYFYNFDNNDPDSICAFQQYTDLAASQDFLKTDSYAAYLKEVEPLLAGPPEITSLTPMWIKAR